MNGVEIQREANKSKPFITALAHFVIVSEELKPRE